MANSRPPHSKLPEQVAESLDPSDEQALDQFCAAFEVETISFEKWCDHHDELDLVYYLCASLDEVRDGCEKLIRLSRTVKETTADGVINRREKIECSVKVPAGVQHGNVLIQQGLGDIHDKAVGDLRVIIQVK